MLLLAKNLLFTVLVPGVVAVVIPLYVYSHGVVEFSVRTVVAGLVLLLGGATYARCLWDFAITGRGTPAPIDPPKLLVVHGL